MRRRVATSAWRAADVTRRGSDVAAATRVARALQRVGASRAASTSSGSGPSAFDWDDDDEVGSTPLEGAARARGFPRASGRPRRVGRVRVEFRRAEIAGVVRGGPPPRAVGRFTKNKKQRRGRRRRARRPRTPRSRVHRVLPVPAPFSSAHAHDRDFAAAVGRGRARRVAARRGRGSRRAPARALRRSRAGVCEAGAGFVDARRLFAAQLLPQELTKLQENLEPITHEHAEVTLSEELDIVTTNEVFAGGLPERPSPPPASPRCTKPN